MADHERPGEKYWNVVKPIWKAVSIYDSSDTFIEKFNSISPAAGHLLAAHWCQSEVRNGGLHQFFTNSTGILAPEAMAGFRAIGLDEWADILNEAMRFFGEVYPREQSDRLAMLDGKRGRRGQRREDWDPFFALDERFYAWLHAEPDRFERAADRLAEGR